MRSYDKPPKRTEKGAFFICPALKCRKKYKTEEKLKKHVEIAHYYETRNYRPSFWFTKEQKIKIYTLAKDYAKLLYGLYIGSPEALIEELTQSSINLLPQHWGVPVEQREIERMSRAQIAFAKNFFSFDLSKCDWEMVMEDLKCFFALGLPYYDTNFCPSIFIDFLWHSCMQDQMFYTEICKENLAYGELIPHCIEREDMENKRFSYFLEVFSRRYGRLPYNPPGDQDRLLDVEPSLEKLIDDLDKPIREFEKQEQEKRIEEELKKEILSVLAKEIGCEISSHDQNYYYYYYKKGYRGKDIKKKVEEEFRISYANMLTSGSC